MNSLTNDEISQICKLTNIKRQKNKRQISIKPLAWEMAVEILNEFKGAIDFGIPVIIKGIKSKTK
jgi:hypothetical protein